MEKTDYQLTVDQQARRASVNIYGTITSAAPRIRSWYKDDTGERSALDIKQAIDALDVDDIDVYINSYGGEVAEACAIYAALRRHKAAVHTFCDGFACSAASVIFCAGATRTIGELGLLMIHNCMSYVGRANSAELRKAADDNDKINQSSIEAYKKVSNLNEDQIKELMNNATWLTAKECIEYGFATEIANNEETDAPEQGAFQLIRDRVLDNSFTSLNERLAAMAGKIDALMQAAEENEPLQQNLDPAPGKKPEETTAPKKPEAKKPRMGSVFALFGANE